jgi:hypothetical protein
MCTSPGPSAPRVATDKTPTLPMQASSLATGTPLY